MLKALEISGFKSFADKTRFEFPAGITVVVGPNGSGKSNIVDAIKWVLGEQSAKSLRGKDMSDVIFKGSTGAGARKPSNAAIATIILDNTDRRFPFDCDEVQVGRRVYRSGETEYLVNGDTARLKDIRNLFRGTGVGTDAYSLIEQGKVDRLLQANAKDRRAIFEEAAGISRFKAKKIEAQRRLSRVEANLIRLADIVEEVGSRYRSVKSQASKAAKYKEYTERLQQLRTFVGMKDWRKFTDKLAQIEQESAGYFEAEKALTGSISEQEKKSKEFETALDQISTQIQKQHALGADIREEIAQAESNIELNETRITDLGERSEQISSQIQRATQRTEEFLASIQKTEKDFEASDTLYRESAEELNTYQARLGELEAQISQLRSSSEKNRSQHNDLVALITEIGRVVSAADSQVDSLQLSQQRYQGEVSSISETLETQQAIYSQIIEKQKKLQQKAESKDTALAEARSRFDNFKGKLDEAQKSLAIHINKHTGLSQRANVIEELEKNQEGINAGAVEILQLAASKSSSAFDDVIGLVADIVSVNVQHAAIVDVALGEFAQYVVVDGNRLVDLLASEKLKVKGRVGIVQLSSPPTLGANPAVNLAGVEGVIGRADRLVSAQEPYVGFVQKMLGGTWLVKTLADALKLQKQRREQVRFVTIDGEIVESDGTVIVGPKSAASGLVSRRSELRALRRELLTLDEEISKGKIGVQELVANVAESDAEIQRLINENTELATQLSEHSSQAASTDQQIQQATRQLQQSQSDLDQATSRLTQLNSQLVGDREKLSANELMTTQLMSLISNDQSSENAAQAERTTVEKKLTTAKVKLAKREQQLEDMQSRLAAYRNEYEEHRSSAEQLQQQLLADKKSKEASESEITNSRSLLEKKNAERESLTEKLTKATGERAELDTKRRELVVELNAKRDELRSVKDKVHEAKLKVEQLNMQRSQLAERMKEDYEIDIATAELSISEEQLAQREIVDNEITDLRKKIGKIGSVNIDSLNELEDLESRYLKMDEQYQDLVEAKETLEKIIVRINADSRRLFVETLEAIRGNFQKLFRQTFGGGKADIVLEEGIDPLEAGVEIIATPPGKPEFNNSLLSGGEKALTAVSLLMAIFQFRPSPFCVLDEVDAPFDEANIGRFIDVLRSFLGWTKFVIVTHSKKTMTAATTLYGITMQESGVSKRVSVRFEDVNDDGEISDDAINRSGDEAA